MAVFFVVLGGELEDPGDGKFLAGRDLAVEVVGGVGGSEERGGAEEAEAEKKQEEKGAALPARLAAGPKKEAANANSSQGDYSWLLSGSSPSYSGRETNKGSGQGERKDGGLLSLGNFLISPDGWNDEDG